MAPAAAAAAGFAPRPKPSSESTPNWFSSRGMAWSAAKTQSSSGVEAQGAAPCAAGRARAPVPTPAGALVSRRAELSNSGAEDAYSSSFGRNCCSSSWIRRSAPSPENSVARNSPVDRSRAANPARSPAVTTAARKLFSSELSDESAAVPGVTTRVTSRRTSFFASRGSSTWSQTATLYPRRISFEI